MTFHLSDRVDQLPKREPVVALPEEPLRAVARRLWEESVGVVVVVGAAGHAAGVLSERDIVAALAAGADPDTATAGEVMTSPIISVHPEDGFLDVAGPMLDHGVRHVAVIGDDGRAVGVVSIRDLVRPLIVDAFERGDVGRTVRAG